MQDTSRDTISSALTPLQKEMWIGQKRHEDLPIYNTAYAFYIKGQVDPSIFSEAHEKLVSSTDVLRLRIREENAVPIQEIVRKNYNSVEYQELTELSDEAFLKRLECKSQKPLDLSKQSWISTLYRRDNDSFVWHFVQHHLFIDGSSFEVLLNRFSSIYQSILEQRLIDADSFPTFISIAKERSERESHTKSPESLCETNQYRSTLYSSSLASQVDPSPKGIRRSRKLEETLVRKILKLSERENFQAFSQDQALTFILLTSIIALLSRIERKNSISIGITHHGRSTKEDRETVGPLVYVHTLQVEVTRKETFQSLHEKVRTAYYAGIKGTVPNPEHLESGKNHDVMFSFFRQDELDFAGNPTTPFWIYPGCHEPQHPWRLHFLAEGEDKLTLLADTLTNSFSSKARSDSEQSVVNTIAAIADDPNQEVSKYPLVDYSSNFASVLLGESPPAFKEQTLWCAFEKTAKENTRSIAASTETEDLDYLRLIEEAKDLSSSIIENKKLEDHMLPVIANRSLDALRSYLACLHAGAAFLPVDPAFPSERISNIVLDSQASFVVDSHFLSTSNSKQVNATAVPNPIAYVLHTSGTTGRSNGVQVGHASVLNLLDDMEKRAPLSSEAKCMWWTAVSFDVSIYEIFSAILYGRRLCIVPEEIRLNSEKLFAWMQSQQIESAYLPPFMLEDFNRWLETNKQLPIKRLLVGVEPIQEDLLTEIASKLEGLTIVNGYGPTETTICATFYNIDKSKPAKRRTPIGKPLQGNRCYVLDRNMQLMPCGTKGELYIAGNGVSNGYWNRSELQTSRFLPDPFSQNSNRELMYKTGDIVRINEEGELEFHGREDAQVKLRGHRIELGEIEETFSKLSIIDQCVASVRTLGTQEELVCFYTTNGSVSKDFLQSHASEHLPFQLQPREFVQLEVFPTTRNGKTDRKALSLVELPEKNELTNRIKAPSDEVEEFVYDVWARHLNIDRFSTTDRFFQLGGTSLTAMEAMLEICEEFDIDLPLQSIFQFPTVSSLSRLIEDTISKEIESLPDEEVDRLIHEQ